MPKTQANGIKKKNLNGVELRRVTRLQILLNKDLKFPKINGVKKLPTSNSLKSKKISENIELKVTRSKTKNEKTGNENCAPNSSSSQHTKQIRTPAKYNKFSAAEKKLLLNSCSLQNSAPRNTRSHTKKAVADKKVETIGLNVRVPEKRLDTIKTYVKLLFFKENSIVLAKQKYSIPWPARVLKVEKDKVKVYFFGDKREGTVNSSEIYDFEKSVGAVKLVITSKKIPRGFATGIREIELLLGVPSKNSVIINEV